jgi:hypothetical protein
MMWINYEFPCAAEYVKTCAFDNRTMQLREAGCGGKFCGGAAHARFEWPLRGLHRASVEFKGCSKVVERSSPFAANLGSGIHRDVAQPGSALAWGARGREFKSRRPDQLPQSVISAI